MYSKRYKMVLYIIMLYFYSTTYNTHFDYLKREVE